MPATAKTGVATATELLLEELAAEIRAINEAGARAFSEGKHDRAAIALETARELTALRREMEDLFTRLEAALTQAHQLLYAVAPTMVVAETPEPASLYLQPPQSVKRDQPPSKQDTRTPESAFRIPILRSLIALGGRAHVQAVLARVYPQVEPILSEYDRLPLKSGETRWRNTAQWERKRLVDEGLLRRDSPKGIWEITDEGRAYLARQLSSGTSPSTPSTTRPT